MEDSLKGVLITLTLISIFITCIVSYIVLFPQEQGVNFSDPSSQTGYLTMQNTTINVQSELNTINNDSTNAFNSWDITQGFMGSNTLKQGSNKGIKSYSNSVFSVLTIMATQTFGQGSPVLWVLAVFLSLTIGYLVYVAITFIRTGK